MKFAFQYFVGKNHGLRDTFDPRADVEAGFYSHPRAIEYAEKTHDGMNWTFVFNTSGKAVYAIPPQRSAGESPKI